MYITLQALLIGGIIYYASLAPLLKHKNFEALPKTRVTGCIGVLDKAVPLNVR